MIRTMCIAIYRFGSDDVSLPSICCSIMRLEFLTSSFNQNLKQYGCAFNYNQFPQMRLLNKP